jgi:hypothetical protein
LHSPTPGGFAEETAMHEQWLRPGEIKLTIDLAQMAAPWWAGVTVGAVVTAIVLLVLYNFIHPRR